MDSHQSFLTVLLQGVIALFGFMFILFKIYRKIKYDHVFYACSQLFLYIFWRRYYEVEFCLDYIYIEIQL